MHAMGGGRGRGPQVFETEYGVFSVAMSGREGLEEGDKILLPPSAFDTLSRMVIDYPILFELTNEPLGKSTHCGVLEFTAEEGRCYMPFWMMQNLIIEEGAILKVKNVTLPKANFVKFRAQSVDFLDISNPKAVLEYTLRKYTCVTTGDMICLPYSGKNYYLEVTEVKPNGAASIIEADVNVDFDEPVGYKAPPRPNDKIDNDGKSDGASADSGSNVGTAFPGRAVQKARVDDGNDDNVTDVFTAFKGNSQRIDGKTPTKGSKEEGLKESVHRSSNAGAKIAASSPEPVVPVAAPVHKSRIGDKFSKKKANLSAFSGNSNKLT